MQWKGSRKTKKGKVVSRRERVITKASIRGYGKVDPQTKKKKEEEKEKEEKKNRRRKKK